jgi:hypothetical protein
MTSKEKIQQEIEQTLQCLDGAKRAEANPFLFTRIKARMDRKANVWERSFSFISKPAIAVAIVVMVMAVNGWALWDNLLVQLNPLLLQIRMFLNWQMNIM